MADYAEHWADSPVCFISFASMGEGDPAGCHFEWKTSLHDNLGASIVLVRDPAYHWYQDGIGGIGTIEQSAEYFRALKSKCERLIAVGVSMGGFGALMYGIMAEIPEIIALAPQTAIGDDPRWKDAWPAPGNRPVPSILPLLPTKSDIKVYIGDDEDAGLDMKQYQAIRHHCWLRQVPGCDHSTLARVMRDGGYFDGFVK